MGYGEYSHAAHLAITRGRIDAAPRFAVDGSHPLTRPWRALREARDSDEHPESLAVAFALDVTGSMGDIPRLLARQTLPDFMQLLLDCGLRDPQLCFLAVGHAGQDQAPLQVGQFESTAALIDQWLTRLWLEGGGAGQHEAYELAMFFAARRMALDCVEKRGQRGFFFLTADVPPNPAVSRVQVERLLGLELEADLPIRALIDELQRRFEPFVLLAPSTAPSVERAWRELFGDRVVRLGAPEDAAHVAAALCALLLGLGGLTAIIDRLVSNGLPRKRGARVAQAIVAFAASVGRDGAPCPWDRFHDLPEGDPPSGMLR